MRILLTILIFLFFTKVNGQTYIPNLITNNSGIYDTVWNKAGVWDTTYKRRGGAILPFGVKKLRNLGNPNYPEVIVSSLADFPTPAGGVITLADNTAYLIKGTVVGSTYGGTGVNNAGRTLTINTNSGTIAFGAASKTLTVNNSIALTGTDGTTMTFPTTSATLDYQTFNQSTAAQGAGFASDTYLTGSSIAIPAGSLKVGSRYHLVFDVSKTAAGTATPVITVRFGTAGTTADAARLTFTFLAGTAAADIGTFEVWITFRAVGASAVIQGSSRCTHRLQVTGLQNLPSPTLQVTSGTFDSGVANSIIGASVNGGASAAWTVQLVQAELSNLN